MIDNKLLLTGEDGYQISRSVRTRQAAGGNFRRVPASAGNAQKFTISMWKKLGSTGGYLAAANLDTLSTLFSEIELTTAGNVSLRSGTLGVSYAWTLTSVQLFRDPAAWYHIVIAYDMTQATSTERCKVWVNNQLLTFTGSYPAQNYSTAFNTTAPQYLAVADGYTAEIHYVDGQQLAPSNFGEVSAATGVWQPKKYLGTYGTNGAYLNFSDPSAATAAAIGKDYSGNGNNWTPNNISVTAGVTYDSMLDVPTMWADGGNGRGNYAVLNPLSGGSALALTGGNLTATTSSSTGSNRFGTIGITGGKWYWEYIVSQSPNGRASVGVATNPNETTSYDSFYGYFSFTGQKFQGTTLSSYGSSWTINDVIAVAFDADAGTLTFYKNNVSQGAAFTGLAGTFFPFVRSEEYSGTLIGHINFGQRPFAYTPPTGFKALNTQNLPEPTIKKGNQYFDVSKWTGNGGTQSITGLAFQPDLVWSKDRSAANFHALYDSVRGATKVIQSNTTTAEQTFATGLTSFNTDGFTTGSNSDTNTNGNSYVGWQWKAGGTAVSNTAGSITSQVSANPTAGFSIVTYTGTGANATVGHGLGVAPKMVIVKCRNTGGTSWPVYHASLGASAFVDLQMTNAVNTSQALWNNTSPTSSVFTVSDAGGTNGNVNFSSRTYVAYCFAEVPGFSKFGSYTGNGSADGPFVYCGFRPRYVLYKRTDTTSNWGILDTSRSTYNEANLNLYPNLSVAEAADTPSLDFLSNGFKLRSTASATNASGGTYIFAAFAENPFKNSLAR